MDSRLESTEMGAAALTHFFTQERWQLEHKEPTAPLVTSPTTGGFTGVLRRQHTDWVAAARQSSPCYQHGPNLRRGEGLCGGSSGHRLVTAIPALSPHLAEQTQTTAGHVIF